MAKIIDRAGKGSEIDVTEFDANYDILHGIVEGYAGTSRTIDVDDQGKTIECTNTGAVALALDSEFNINAAIDTSSFHVSVFNAASSTVTITPAFGDSINGSALVVVLNQYEQATFTTSVATGGWSANINRANRRNYSGLGNYIDNFEGLSQALGNETRMLFRQNTAPTGWTKVTTNNDKALRVVSGNLADGGVNSFSTIFGSGTTTFDTVLTLSQIPAHTHSFPLYGLGGSSQVIPQFSYNSVFGGTYTTVAGGGGGLGHSHETKLDLQFIDVIVAVKD